MYSETGHWHTLLEIRSFRRDPYDNLWSWIILKFLRLQITLHHLDVLHFTKGRILEEEWQVNQVPQIVMSTDAGFIQDWIHVQLNPL
jgi:hypothetical protein